MDSTKVTKKQKHIIFLIYQFRYLTVNLLAKLLHHKDDRRINEWLKDLATKDYISRIKRREQTSPFIYCLNTKAQDILIEEDNTDKKLLSRLRKEKNKSERFINHHLLIADLYLFFLFQKGKKEDLQFFTKTELFSYNYFPDTELDAYITVENGKETTRYLLNAFDPYTPSFVYRKRVKEYLAYAKGGKWEVNTNNEPLPIILFVCHSENMRKHTYNYAKARLRKTFEDVSIFLTTQEVIRKTEDKNNIWQAVE